MGRKQEFDYARVPNVLYHGAQLRDRASIEAKGLTGGHVTEHVDLAAEYGTPDLYEVKKHPNIVDSADPNNEGNYWALNSGVYWANNVPTSHVKRVGHVIRHLNEDGELEHADVHWHLRENCPLKYDLVHPIDVDDSFHDMKNVRPHPTDPQLTVSDY